MKVIFYQLAARIRRFVWSFIVAYMVGMHNFYHGDQKTADDIMITTEVNEVLPDSEPED
ncbi:MAG: hypothetical protein ABJA70_23420 [Chryseolinea sp.]